MPRRPDRVSWFAGLREARARARRAPSRASRVTGPRRWCFRVGVAILAPLLFLLLLELALRVAGVGFPTAFLLPEEHAGRKVFVQNNRFGWRFFGPDQSPQPACFAIPRQKPADTVRVFVFGESAAFGDPQPEFGLPRLLQAMLSLRHPGVRFEIVNAAMTGINSHTILPIARDCARADGDIWVIYMGNNEVIGPFGAGTVFGPQAPPLAIIRGSLALKSTRTGQWLDRALRWFRRPPADKSEWGGLLMFLRNQVPADDPRQAVVHRHFERNLEDILSAGRRGGAGIVLSTVAVNLKDCAPFASTSKFGPGDTNSPGSAGILPANSATSRRREVSAPRQSDPAKWTELYQRGSEAQQGGRFQEAAGLFRDAAQLDDSAAELQFRWATTALALGEVPEAQRRFRLARDLDTLRFRCDQQLNAITRRVATGRADARILLADAEETFARQSPGGVPGGDYFYEHVHLTFEGNYLLARTVAVEIEKLLPEKARRRPDLTQPWPPPEACARRLAWTDANRLAAVTEMRARLHDPPFTFQLNHADQIRRLTQQAGELQLAAPAASAQAELLFREALAAAPDDPVLHSQHAEWQAAKGDLENAAASARRAVELVPHSAVAWGQLGDVLVLQQQFGEAAGAFAEAFRRDPDNFWALHNLAQSYAKLGRRDDAMREYRRAIRIKPRFGMAYLGLGQLLESAGRKAEAEENFRLALRHRVHRAPELTTLARFCHQRGWVPEALTNYLDAIQLNPLDALLQLGAGQCLAALGRPAESVPYFNEAVRLAPGSAEACFLLGLEFGRQGRPVEAGDQFREAVRLRPDLVEARANLGAALINQGRDAEARAVFEEVLRRSPTNAVALKYLREGIAR